jgi:hypothetical protein
MTCVYLKATPTHGQRTSISRPRTATGDVDTRPIKKTAFGRPTSSFRALTLCAVRRKAQNLAEKNKMKTAQKSYPEFVARAQATRAYGTRKACLAGHRTKRPGTRWACMWQCTAAPLFTDRQAVKRSEAAAATLSVFPEQIRRKGEKVQALSPVQHRWLSPPAPRSCASCPRAPPRPPRGSSSSSKARTLASPTHRYGSVECSERELKP